MRDPRRDLSAPTQQLRHVFHRTVLRQPCLQCPATHVLHHHRARGELRRPSLLLLLLLAVQITLGALTVLSGKQHVINSLHVVTGAFVLGTSLVLTLRAYRPQFGFEDVRSGVRTPRAGTHLVPDPGSRIPSPGGAGA